MMLCPFDTTWCERTACRTGICEVCTDRPPRICSECGSTVESQRLQRCGECTILEIESAARSV